MAKNSPGITFTVAGVQSKPALSKELRFRLCFSSERSGAYSAELAPGGNAAAEDDFVYQGVGMQVPIHTKDSLIRAGLVCGGSRRRYVRPKAIVASSFLDASMMTRL